MSSNIKVNKIWEYRKNEFFKDGLSKYIIVRLERNWWNMSMNYYLS